LIRCHDKLSERLGTTRPIARGEHSPGNAEEEPRRIKFAPPHAVVMAITSGDVGKAMLTGSGEIEKKKNFYRLKFL
jgi:hypothetical protein